MEKYVGFLKDEFERFKKVSGNIAYRLDVDYKNE
jgi:hypothetical protein